MAARFVFIMFCIIYQRLRKFDRINYFQTHVETFRQLCRRLVPNSSENIEYVGVVNSEFMFKAHFYVGSKMSSDNKLKVPSVERS